MSHLNFHLPGGRPAETEEEVEDEIRDEHLVLVQDRNDEQEHENDEQGGVSEDTEWVRWERDSFEVQTVESDVGRYQPISWYESQQWLFVLRLFHHMCFVLELSMADIQLPETPVLAIRYMQYIYRGRNPQARLKLFIKYST